ncbi:MAG: hypothetical protein JXA41_01280, partial [Deltaproteobacteria bacterium]|nr:hypothetical protein [Deltaproteobacteria bacterium]
VCENNQMAMGTPIVDQMRNPEIVARAAGYGMHGVRVDGQDVIAVYEAVHEAVELARKGKGPSLVECWTYRFAGHTDFEPNWRAGRPEDEYNYWRSRDPIDILEKQLFKNGQMDDAAKAEIQERVQREIDEAVAYAESQPRLSEEDLYSCVYCEELSSIGS